MFDVRYLMLLLFLIGACGFAELSNMHSLQYLNIQLFSIKTTGIRPCLTWRKNLNSGFCYATSCCICIEKKRYFPKHRTCSEYSEKFPQTPERSICCGSELPPGQTGSCTMTPPWSLLGNVCWNSDSDSLSALDPVPGTSPGHPHLAGSLVDPAVSVALALGCENPPENRDLWLCCWVQVCSSTASVCLLCRETGTVHSSWNSWTLPCSGKSAHQGLGDVPSQPSS